MEKARFMESARACLANGNHILKDVEWAEFLGDPTWISFYLAAIAQEEFAKGFLLCLVARDVIPWNSLIYRASHDHKCKQLLALIMEHVIPDDDEFFRRMEDWHLKYVEHGKLIDALREAPSIEEQKRIWERINAISESSDRLPRTVKDAINILREKVGLWDSWFCWAEEPNFDRTAKEVGDGKAEREKQNALYVRLNKNGEVIGVPGGITPETAKHAMDRAERMGRLVEDLLAGQSGIFDYEKIESAFKAVFADLAARTKPDAECNG
jgi:hypothetical protein